MKWKISDRDRVERRQWWEASTKFELDELAHLIWPFTHFQNKSPS